MTRTKEEVINKIKEFDDALKKIIPSLDTMVLAKDITTASIKEIGDEIPTLTGIQIAIIQNLIDHKMTSTQILQFFHVAVKQFEAYSKIMAAQNALLKELDVFDSVKEDDKIVH